MKQLLPAISHLAGRHANALLVILGLVIVTPLIWTDQGMLGTSVSTAVTALLALSVGLCFGQAGVLSLAQAGFAVLGAYGTAIVTTRWELSPFIGLAVAITLPAVTAYGLALAVQRLSHLGIAIATLVFGQVVVIGVREGGEFTGGYIGISGIPELSIASTPYQSHLLAWLTVAAVVALMSNLASSTRGRSLRTIRHDQLRAQADGVAVPTSLAGALSMSAGIAGVAGWLYAHHFQYLAPASIPFSVSIEVVLMAVVGGATVVLGPVAGALLLTFAHDLLPSEAGSQMVFGLILISAIVAMPPGLLGSAQAALTKRKRRHPTPGPTQEAIHHAQRD